MITRISTCITHLAQPGPTEKKQTSRQAEDVKLWPLEWNSNLLVGGTDRKNAEKNARTRQGSTLDYVSKSLRRYRFVFSFRVGLRLRRVIFAHTSQHLRHCLDRKFIGTSCALAQLILPIHLLCPGQCFKLSTFKIKLKKKKDNKEKEILYLVTNTPKNITNSRGWGWGKIKERKKSRNSSTVCDISIPAQKFRDMDTILYLDISYLVISNDMG